MKKDTSRIIEDVYTKDSRFWEEQGRKHSLEVARYTAMHVPAYQDFLEKHKVSRSIKTWKTFTRLPITSKKNYLKTSPLSGLITEDPGPLVFSSTSGSTGAPFFFPRREELEWQYSIFLEIFMRHFAKEGRTLVIICFGMGVWIGGLISYKAFELLGKRSFHLSIIAPGINKKEIFNTLRNLSKQHNRTVLVGYPPFIKDIVDEAPDEGINLKELNVKFLFAAEAFTEEFRDYLATKVKINSIYHEALNIYGTADIGAMAFETPTAVLVRRTVLNNRELAEKIFGKIKHIPTLAQYNPYFVNFETVDGEILVTGKSAIPLVRYAIGDHGGTYTFSDLESLLKESGIDIRALAIQKGVAITELPFVYVYERNDFSTTLYGLQIYPGNIRNILLQKEFRTFLTGKFTLLTVFDSKNNQILEIHLELRRGRIASDKQKKRLLQAIVDALRENNSEFRELSDFLGERAYPKLVCWPLGDPEHFQTGIKQKWVKK